MDAAIGQMSAAERQALLAAERGPSVPTSEHLESAINEAMTGAPWADRYPKNPEQWENQVWRLHNIYYIVGKDGNKVQFKPNWAQVGLIENLWFLNVILKARQFGFCLDPNTRVLTAGLRWARIADMQPGERIVSFDEYPEKAGKGQARKLRTAVVEGVVEVFRKAYRITFDDGRSVVCTGQHPWLSMPAGGSHIDFRAIEGDSKKKLRVGSLVRWITKPWGDGDYEDGWFGEFWEGRELPGKKSGEGWAAITAIEELAEQTMIDLQTSRGTYIAEGFCSHNTTFIDLLMLDNAVWQSDQRNGIIAHNKEDAKVIFRDKVKFPFDNLPPQIRQKLDPKLDSANELLFANNSSIRVGTSMRSGTFQMLHISEYGKLCAQYPEKAREVKTGALNTVQKGQIVFIESTAEGRSGHFYELCTRAQNMQKMGKKLSSLDWRFHFFPWWISPDYELQEDEISPDMVLPSTLLEYFVDLESKIGKRLSAGQKLWYWKKWEDQGDDMKREYPSTPEEAFSASIQGAYYANQMAKVRLEKRIRPIPYIEAFPVDTFWDFGYNDRNVIWFMQHVGLEYRFIDYYSNSGEALAHYVKILTERPYIYGKHYLPWDAGHKDLKRRESLEDRFRDLHVRNTVTVPRIDEERDGYEAVRSILGQCWFDESRCDEGITGLDHYKKEWDDKLGEFKDTPKHDWASHPAKAFETFAVGYRKRPQAGSMSSGRGTRRRPNSGMAL